MVFETFYKACPVSEPLLQKLEGDEEREDKLHLNAFFVKILWISIITIGMKISEDSIFSTVLQSRIYFWIR